ncbi:MAG TPA: hypothetical protein VFG35_15515 [Actinoplanes sp.]|nr:hypothetical protein [Actinoplanes sp.]
MRAISAGRPGRRENEDVVVTVGDLVAVLDGVTAPAALDSGCEHGPAWYARQLAGHLAQAYLRHPAASLPDLLAAAIGGVRTLHSGCDLANPATPAAAICVLRAGPQQVDYLVLCDTTLVLDCGAEPRVITDDRLSATITALRAAEPNEPLTGVSPEEVRRRHALARNPYANRPGGYWIAAADPAAAWQAMTGSMLRHGTDRVRRAALLTDGARRVVDDFALTDWPGLLDLLAHPGPATLVDRLRAAELSAKPGRPGAKTHDDASAALCVFPKWNTEEGIR